MKIPEIDSRNADMLRKRVLELAQAYTPEWKPSPQTPDVGMTLAELYLQMYQGTIRHLNRTAEKYQIAFCNFIGAERQNSDVAAGYVKFGLSSDQLTEGVLVSAGAVLAADAPDGETLFTTTEDVRVSSAELSAMFATDGRKDLIQQINQSDLVLFQEHSANLNSHTAWIGCQSELLRIAEKSTIVLTLEQDSIKGKPLAEELKIAFQNKKADIFYSTEQGWEAFRNCSAQGNRLTLVKETDQPSSAARMERDTEMFWIKLELYDIQALTSFAVSRILLSVSGSGLLPEAILTKIGVQETDSPFYAFGENPALFDAFYISSDEVLTKAGEQISMQLIVSFLPLPEIPKIEKPVGAWKPVMKKADIIVEEPEIVSIDTVCWEYFNGTGWKPLPCEQNMQLIFRPSEGTRIYQLVFRCPFDMQPAILEAEYRRFIRARITRMNQNFYAKPLFRAPLVSGIRFSYDSNGKSVPASEVMTQNQMQFHHFYSAEHLMLFSPLPEEELIWYLGFTASVSCQKMLFVTEQQTDTEMPVLRWEYYHQGSWKPLECYDETGQFAHTGFLNIADCPDAEAAELFGLPSLYWIRGIDTTDAYRNNGQYHPHILKIETNCTEVRNYRILPPEYFSLPAPLPYFQCVLSEQNLCHLEVWVNELGLYSSTEIQDMIQQGTAEAEYTISGVLERLWVRWQPVRNFLHSGSEDKHYCVDKNSGIVTFGDDVHGKIPYLSKGDHIRIKMASGGGSCGNVPEGAINRSLYSFGLVTKISNPLALNGGNDSELLADAISRTAADFRNGGRCVAVSDYEDIARRTERSILKVKCIPGYNAEAEPEAGSITVLILRSDFAQEASGFYMIQAKLLQELNARRSLSAGRCYVSHPRYIRICVTAKVLSSNGRIYQVKEQVQKRIAEFLNPITGNFDGKGWEIGQIPHRQQIENAIRSVSGVAYVEDMTMRAFLVSGQEQTEQELAHLTAAEFSIVISGEHNVQVRNRTDAF